MMMILNAALLSLLPVMSAASAAAQERPAQPRQEDGAPEDKDGEDRTLDRAGEIATQPVRDVGISKKSIPPVLQAAVDAPYAQPASHWCRSINAELVQLNDVLGPDFDARGDGKENKVGRFAEAGGEMVVNSLIPFRGLVREISGAGPADRRRALAIQAGLARRGYLRGLADARRCKPPVTAAATGPQDTSSQRAAGQAGKRR